MDTVTQNPPEPSGTATEKVFTYFRTPKHYKGREWLEKELGQIRLFEYNPPQDHPSSPAITVTGVGDKVGVFLQSQLLKTFANRANALEFRRSLLRKAKAIQAKENPGPHTETAAELAEEAIGIFDVDHDFEADAADVAILKAAEPQGHTEYHEPVLVVDPEAELVGEILSDSDKGRVVIGWQDGQRTYENPDHLFKHNGFNSWVIRRRAKKAYGKSLKYSQKAAAARQRQGEFEKALKANPDVKKALKNNPGLLSVIAEAGGAIKNAIDIGDAIKKAQKKPRKTIHQRVAAAKRQGTGKIQFAKNQEAKLRAYAKQNGGRVELQNSKLFYVLPKAKNNPGDTAMSQKFETFQGRKPTNVTSVWTPDGTPKNIYKLGDLYALKVVGRAVEIDYRKELTGKVWNLEADRCDNLYVTKGGPSFEKDSSIEEGLVRPLGELQYVVYETEKVHLGDKKSVPYIHRFSHPRPVVGVDRKGAVHILGGGYEIEREGIVG